MRAVELKIEAPKGRQRGLGSSFFEEIAASPSPSTTGSGERCKLPSGVWGGAPAEIEFGTF